MATCSALLLQVISSPRFSGAVQLTVLVRPLALAVRVDTGGTWAYTDLGEAFTAYEVFSPSA